MNYPLQLEFKKIAINEQIFVRDAGGSLLWYVRQKAFKLREAVTVFADEAQTQPVFTFAADRVIDFSAQYHIADARNGVQIGTLQRQGMRSLWRANYEVVRGGVSLFTISEENPWTKVLDTLLFEIPIVGIFSGYLFHPRYLVKRTDGTAVVRLQKESSFLQGRFSIHQLEQMPPEDEQLLLLGILMLVLLEKQRG